MSPESVSRRLKLIETEESVINDILGEAKQHAGSDGLIDMGALSEILHRYGIYEAFADAIN